MRKALTNLVRNKTAVEIVRMFPLKKDPNLTLVSTFQRHEKRMETTSHRSAVRLTMSS